MILPIATDAQLLEWVGLQLHRLAVERRSILTENNLLFIANGGSGINQRNPPQPNTRLYDIGIIMAYLKVVESDLFDTMEGLE